MPLQYFSTLLGIDVEDEEDEEEVEEEEEVDASPDVSVRSRKSASASKVRPQAPHVGLGDDRSEFLPPAWETAKRVVWQIGQARS